MLYTNTLNEITNNINTGIEYEIALFCKLASTIEQKSILSAINNRIDCDKVLDIIEKTDTKLITDALQRQGLKMYDVTFETQNDDVGPSDIVMIVENVFGTKSKIGISVKYDNTCSLNVTGRKFITEQQITNLKEQLPSFIPRYIEEMGCRYGTIDKWLHQRKPSLVTDEYIDLIRDAVIENWGNLTDKVTLLSAMFHIDSPIDFWVVTYNKKGYSLKTQPQTIEISRASDVVVKKYQTSYISFYLDDVKVGQMEVKLNNGIVEKCKKKVAYIECEGKRLSYGKPFSYWYFSVEK